MSITRTMPPEVIEEAQKAFDGIAGVRISRVQWLYDRTSTMTDRDEGPERGVIFVADVWGPTLHRRVRRWPVAMGNPGANTAAPPISDEDAVEMARIGLFRSVSLQRGMHAFAAREGIDAPMAHLNGYSLCDVAHLSMHAGLLDLMVANRGGRGAAAMLLDQVERMISSDHDNSDTTISTSELDDDMQTRVHFDGLRSVLYKRERLSGDTTFDGLVVDMRRVLPDTMLTAMTGRPLGDVLRTGLARLDRSRIVKATESDGTTIIHIDEDLVAIGEDARLT